MPFFSWYSKPTLNSQVDYKDFHYPLEGDVLKWADQLRHGQTPDKQPINAYNHSFLYSAAGKCEEREFPRLVFIVKSAIDHFDRRKVIRVTWANEKRFSDVIIRVVFLLGTPPLDNPLAQRIQGLVDVEAGHYQDIVQSDFIDAYFNNTIKTMSGLRWAVENCPQARFYMFVDDDYYVSTKNVLRFLRNPVHYPEYLEEADETIRQLARKLADSNSNNNNSSTQLELVAEVKQVLGSQNSVAGYSLDSRKHLKLIRDKYDEMIRSPQKRQRRSASEMDSHGDSNSRRVRRLLEMQLPLDVKLFSGFVINSSPHRHKSSKWYLGLDEYPYHLWPPYVSAGAYILSREALIQMYYVSKYTKHFR